MLLENSQKKFAKKIPGTKKNNKFWSSGISVVLHPKNPKFQQCILILDLFVQKNWFGGGIDLTPCLKDDKKKIFF